MIAYDLKCRAGDHRFEGWFGSAADFQKQRESGLLCCPICGSVEVERALSVPNVGAKGNQRPASPPREERQAAQRSAPAPTSPESTGQGSVMQVPALSPQMHEALGKIAEAQAKMLEKSEWVGRRFAEEVRAQHYGETEARQVHGETSAEEARGLVEEGIDIMPVLFPVAPPEKRN